MVSPDIELVRNLEQHSAQCWPATFVDSIHGWEIRRTPDISSGRVNSVNAIVPEPGTFDRVLVKARALFDEQEEWPLIRIHPLAGDEPVHRLAALGLHGQGHTLVKTVSIRNRTPPAPLSFLVTDKMTADWMSAFGDAHDTAAEERQAIARTLARVTVNQGFAVVYEAGRPVASGRGAVADGWLGLFQISTLPDMRRRGFGRAIIEALIGWGQEQGANQAYLQVERKNEGARTLYRTFGFRTAYEYSYWWLPDTVEIATIGS